MIAWHTSFQGPQPVVSCVPAPSNQEPPLLTAGPPLKHRQDHPPSSDKQRHAFAPRVRFVSKGVPARLTRCHVVDRQGGPVSEAAALLRGEGRQGSRGLLRGSRRGARSMDRLGRPAARSLGQPRCRTAIRDDGGEASRVGRTPGVASRAVLDRRPRSDLLRPEERERPLCGGRSGTLARLGGRARGGRRCGLVISGARGVSGPARAPGHPGGA